MRVRDRESGEKTCQTSNFPVWFGICFLFLGTLLGLIRAQKRGFNLNHFLGVSKHQENYTMSNLERP